MLASHLHLPTAAWGGHMGHSFSTIAIDAYLIELNTARQYWHRFVAVRPTLRSLPLAPLRTEPHSYDTEAAAMRTCGSQMSYYISDT